MGIDDLTIDTDCIDGSGCAPGLGSFQTANFPKPKAMSSSVVKTPPTPSVQV